METKTIFSYLKKWQYLLFSISFILFSFTSISQTQIGADIDGEAAGDRSGHSVSMPDAYTVAVGAFENDGNGVESGHVRIYRWIGNSWVQKGMDIDGEAFGNRSGFSVSMPDSNTVAIGAPYNIDNGRESGHVRVYRWIGNSWVQKGGDIDGDTTNCSFGYSVSMADSNTMVIGAPNHDLGGLPYYNIGQIKVYEWNGNAWVQKGSNIDGIAINDQFGSSVSMPDRNTLGVGAPYNDSSSSDAGLVQIYRWNGASWVQKGMDIYGDTVLDRLGSISMPDSITVAVGAQGNNFALGKVRIYRWNGISWVQKGMDIISDTARRIGGPISMSDSNTLAVGAYYDGNGANSDHVRIYRWIGNNWQQSGIDIAGEAVGDIAVIVSMPDSNTVAIGAPLNDGNGTSSGHVRVYSICNNTVDTSVTLSANTLIANDSTATYQWVNCDSAYAAVIGETNRSFTPPNTGNYSVIVSRSHCVDTSACYNVVITGLERRLENNIKILVYPNPTNGVFTIESTSESNNEPFEIRDITGKTVLKGNLRDKQTTIDLSENSSGVYILRVGDQNIKIVRK